VSKATLQWTIIDDIAISCSTDGEVPSNAWRAYMADLTGKRVRKILSLAIGQTSLTSVQRKEAADIAKSQKVASAVVTDDRLVRGMLTALSWLGVDVKAYSWDQLSDALDHLAVPQGVQRQRVMAAAHELRDRMKGSKIL
jgi:hypothetical protein